MSDQPASKPCRGTGILMLGDWKIEHRQDGVSFIGYPYQDMDKIKYCWIGQMEPYAAEWLLDAVKRKQAKEIKTIVKSVRKPA